MTDATARRVQSELRFLKLYALLSSLVIVTLSWRRSTDRVATPSTSST